MWGDRSLKMLFITSYSHASYWIVKHFTLYKVLPASRCECIQNLKLIIVVLLFVMWYVCVYNNIITCRRVMVYYIIIKSAWYRPKSTNARKYQNCLYIAPAKQWHYYRLPYNNNCYCFKRIHARYVLCICSYNIF